MKRSTFEGHIGTAAGDRYLSAGGHYLDEDLAVRERPDLFEDVAEPVTAPAAKRTRAKRG